jgi:hypothetical protein
MKVKISHPNGSKFRMEIEPKVISNSLGVLAGVLYVLLELSGYLPW